MKEHLGTLAFLFIVVGLVPACFSAAEANAQNRDALLKRVKFDLDCQKEEVELTELSRWNNDEINSYGVNGCGQKAVYVLHDGRWVLNSEQGEAGGEQGSSN